MAIVVDAGVLVAAADTGDADHQRCSGLLRENRGRLVVPAPVIPEASWQVEHNLGPRAEAAFLRLITGRHLRLVDLTLADWVRCIELIEAYEDLGLGLVDTSIVAAAERLGETKIATLNHRDFTVGRPAHCDAFELVPSRTPTTRPGGRPRRAETWCEWSTGTWVWARVACSAVPGCRGLLRRGPR